MTAFEHFFRALKECVGRPEAYEIWPNFEPVYKKEEYVWTVLSKLGEVLLLNCGQCEGPSDIRHSICRKCVMDRTKIAAEDYYETTGKLKDKWPIVILCRVFKW